MVYGNKMERKTGSGKKKLEVGRLKKIKQGYGHRHLFINISNTIVMFREKGF